MPSHLRCNGDANYENASKKIDYPEHKLKNREGIVLKDFDQNERLIDNSKAFYQEMEVWYQDRRELNFNRKHHKNRTLSEEEFQEKILQKGVATTYTLQENSLFFEQKFNGDHNKIKEYYELYLECFLEEANIPKDKVINAIIHFDQTNPHLHFAISNIHEKYSKEHQKMVKTINKEKYHLFEHLKENKRQNKEDWERWKEFKKLRYQYYNHEISENDWQAYLDKNYNVGILSNVEKRLNQKYEERYSQGLYLAREDYIYMHDIRGFTNHDILNISRKRSMTEKYIKMQNNIVLKSRDTELNSNLKSFRYKKPLLREDKEQQFIYQIQLDIDNDDLFEKYLDAKYNKQCKEFILNAIKSLNEAEKEKMCNVLGFDYQKDKNISLSKAILLANQMKALNDVACLAQYSLHDDYDWSIPIQNISNEDKAKISAIYIMAKELNIPKLNESLKSVPFIANVEQCEAIIDDIRTISIEACDFLDKNGIYERNKKNYYFIKEQEWMSKRMNYFIDQELNKLEPNQVKLELSSYEQKLMFKKVLQERIDFDLKTLNLYESFKVKGLNNIERMREYNKILSYCAHIQFEVKQQWEYAKDYLKENKDKILEINNKEPLHLDNKDQNMLDQYQEMHDIYKLGADFTPQILAKRIYEKAWEPLDYEQELKIIDIKLAEDNKEIKSIKLENLKEIEYSILNVGASFKEVYNEFQLVQEENRQNGIENKMTFKQYENKYLEEYIQNFQNNLKMDSRLLAYEAKELNNWFNIDNLEEDLNLGIKNKWEDQELESILKELENNNIQFENLSETKEFDTAGINIDFISKLNEELTLDFIKDFSIESKELRNNNWNELDYYEPTVAEKYASYFACNEQEMKEISKNAKDWIKEVKLNHIVALAKKGYDIDELCKEIEIDPKRVKYQINKAKEMNIGRDERIVEMTLGRK